MYTVSQKNIPDVFSYNSSERYMAKACAYLCRQCRCIDSFGEFSEYHILQTVKWISGRRGRPHKSINQSIYLVNCATTKSKCQQNNVKHSDGLPEKQIAHLSWSPK